MSRVQTVSEQLPDSDDLLGDSIDTTIEDDGSADEVMAGLLTDTGIQDLTENPALSRVIRGAMDGSLPLDEPLEVNQPRKLSPRALQTILLSIGGFYTLKEIASISGMDYVYVTKLVKHPYAKRIRTIANTNSVAQMSAVENRLRRHSPKMLKIVKEVAENEQIDAGTRVRAAFGWLDRAGHNQTTKTETNHKVSGTVTVSHKRSKLIAEAIREATEPMEAEVVSEEVEEEEMETSDAA